MTDFRRMGVFLVLVGFSYFPQVRTPTPANSCDDEASFSRLDKTLFGVHCGGCHSVTGRWKRVGPPLGGLFERKQLVSGQPVNDETVRGIIAKGGPALMPGFQYTLKAGEIEELVQHLKDVRCPAVSGAQQEGK